MVVEGQKGRESAGFEGRMEGNSSVNGGCLALGMHKFDSDSHRLLLYITSTLNIKMAGVARRK